MKIVNRIYIAGKITGEPYLTCYQKFSVAEETLKQFYYEPINPMKLCKPNWSWIRCMGKGIFYLIFRSDAIMLLPDWKQSKGAKIEYWIAKKTGKKFIEYNLYIRVLNEHKTRVEILNRIWK